MDKSEVYRQLIDASSSQFKVLLSKNEIKEVILSLVGTRSDIDELGLSTRVSNRLRRAGINSVYELLGKYPYSLTDRFNNADLMLSKGFARELSGQIEIYLRDIISAVYSETEKMEYLPKDFEDYDSAETHDEPYENATEVSRSEFSFDPVMDLHSEDRFFSCDKFGEIAECLGDNDALIEELGLSLRSYKALKRFGVNSVRKLVTLTVEQINDIFYLGEKSKDEIREKLALYVRDNYIKTEEKANSLKGSDDTAPMDKGGEGLEVDTDGRLTEFSFDPVMVLQNENHFFNCDKFGELVEYYEVNNARIEELGLSVRAYNALKRSGVDNVRKLLTLTVKQINGIHNLGERSKNEIREKLALYVRNTYLQNGTIGMESTEKEAEESFLPLVGSLYEHSVEELMTIPTYRDMIIEWFKQNGATVENTQLSNRARKALLRSHICNIGQLLELSPNELENIPNLGKSSAKEIASFIHFQLKENKKQYCAFIENGGEPVLSNDDIEQLLLDMYNGADFYGFSFKEFRERIPESVSDEELKKAVSEMLRSGFIEYVDFRCYKVYPKFCELVKDKSGFSMLTGSEYDILLGRFAGKTLQELADERDLTRERIRQVLLKIFRKIVNYAIANNIVFDEDYYRYLYENYSIDRAAWKNELGCSEQICSYLDMCYKKGKNTDLNDALRDNNVTVNLKYRLQKVIDRNKIRIGNLKIDRKRKELVSFILKKYCHNDISFDDFVKLYNDMMKKYNVPFDESIYITDNSLKTQANIISRREDVLWKYGGTIRYYDRSEYDYTLLLDTLDLSRYKNTERSTYKWIMDYPDLMKEYDIRDQYELHIILKAVVDRDTVHDIDFSRQPIIRFGTFDREKELKELLAEVSPIDTDSLVKVIQERYGYSEAMVRVNCLGSLSEFFNNGIYTSAFKWLSNEQISSLKLLLTEDYYSIDEITAIYSEAFPNESPDDINPLTLKQLGFTVNNRYVIQNFPSADKYFRYILGKDDISDISALRKKYSEAYNTFSAILKRMLTEYEIFYFEPDQTINIRRLEKLGITKNTIVDFCDSVAGFVGNNDYFNIHSLRLRGFEHKLDDLGMDEYFYDSILTADSRFAWGQMFNKTILRKTSEKATIVRSEVITAIIKDKTVISCGEITNTLRTMYGIVLDRDHWYLFDKAVEICGMYFDRTMEKIYKDKSYYYEDIEKEDY